MSKKKIMEYYLLQYNIRRRRRAVLQPVERMVSLVRLDPRKGADGGEGAVRRQGLVARADRERGRHPGLPRGHRLLVDVRDEEHLARLAAQGHDDLAVGGGLPLVAHLCVKIAAQIRPQVTGVGVAEEQLLRLAGAAAVDGHAQAVLGPAVERGRHVAVHLALEGAAVEAKTPDVPLQLLQRGDLPVDRDLPLHVGHHRRPDLLVRCSALRRGDGDQPCDPVPRVPLRLRPERGHVRRALLLPPVGIKVAGDVVPCVREHHVVHEGDGRGRALNVQQDHLV
mmetsp:Transcript_49573/g.85243  ORF Transcript_49573/g.85243 Transcript_49573/m.85243 type:complete len:281 (+) Transcript_49573:250-1092(+)